MQEDGEKTHLSMSAIERALLACVHKSLPCVRHETDVFVCSLSARTVPADAFILWWLRAFGVRHTPSNLPVVLRRPRVPLGSLADTALRLHPMSASDILNKRTTPAAAAVEAAPSSARLLLLIDMAPCNTASAADKTLLCWAWIRAFPSMPEDLVRLIGQHLGPGALRDERERLQAVVQVVAARRGAADLEVGVALCNAAAALDTDTSSTAAANRHLQHVRGLVHDAASEAVAAATDRAAADVRHAGLDFMPATAPRSYVLMAPSLSGGAQAAPQVMPFTGAFRLQPPMSMMSGRMWSQHGKRLCQMIFFQELAFVLTSGSHAERHTSSYHWLFDMPRNANDPEEEADGGAHPQHLPLGVQVALP